MLICDEFCRPFALNATVSTRCLCDDASTNHSFVYYSFSQQVQSLVQSQISTQCDLELPSFDVSILSSSSNSFLRLLPRLPVTSTPPFIFPSVTCRRRQFLRKM
jgi:hypothetical protein